MPYLLGQIFMYDILFQLRNSQVVRLFDARNKWKKTREPTIKVKKEVIRRASKGRML